LERANPHGAFVVGDGKEATTAPIRAITGVAATAKPKMVTKNFIILSTPYFDVIVQRWYVVVLPGRELARRVKLT
jgi:hypothetical protein